MRVPMKKYYFPYDGAYGGVGGVRRPYYADPGSKLIAHTDLAAVVVFQFAGEAAFDLAVNAPVGRQPGVERHVDQITAVVRHRIAQPVSRNAVVQDLDTAAAPQVLQPEQPRGQGQRMLFVRLQGQPGSGADLGIDRRAGIDPHIDAVVGAVQRIGAGAAGGHFDRGFDEGAAIEQVLPPSRLHAGQQRRGSRVLAVNVQVDRQMVGLAGFQVLGDDVDEGAVLVDPRVVDADAARGVLFRQIAFSSGGPLGVASHDAIQLPAQLAVKTQLQHGVFQVQLLVVGLAVAGLEP